MKYPFVKFTDSTDYTEAEDIVKRMFACVLATGDVCCKSIPLQKIICQAKVYKTAIVINTELSNTSRYKQNVEDAYKLLWPIANCYTG